MDNKLSELSKPVAWPNGCNETAVKALRYLAENNRPTGGESTFNTEHLYMIAREVERMSREPLYSQEYVSALLAELEAKDERIGWLEAIATDYMGKFQKAQDALKYAAIMIDEDKKKISELEAKLATPVRLPGSFYPDGDADVSLVIDLDETVKAIRANGFTVEGDDA